MQKVYKISAARKEELERELQYLKTVREVEVAEQIKEARSFGDLSENSEYDEAKNEQGKVFSRIAEVENILSNAVVIDTEHVNTSEVNTGCRVVVLDIEENESEEYIVVGSQEANPAEGRISDESPFGRALVGHKVGEEITVEAPLGTFRYRIMEIHG